MSQKLTVVHPLANSLQDFYVNNRCASIVSVVIKFLISCYSPCPLPCCQGQGCVMCDAGNDRVHVKGENRRVDVDFIRVEDLRVRQRWEERFR